MRISILSTVIGAASIAVEDVAAARDLDCMVAHDSKWCSPAQDQFAACEATIDILQRLRYMLREFNAEAIIAI